jgi:hypothetical protein
MVSYGGAKPWSSHFVPSAKGCAYLGLTSSPVGGPPWATFTLANAVGVGRFKGTSASQALVWNGRGLCIVDGLGSSAGPWTIGPWSRQDMN